MTTDIIFCFNLQSTKTQKLTFVKSKPPLQNSLHH